MPAKKWNENVELLAIVMIFTSTGLIFTSLAAYNKPDLFGGKQQHYHSLIPAGIGALIGLSSLGVRSEKARKAAAHIAAHDPAREGHEPLSSSQHGAVNAVLAGVLGVVGAVPGLMKLPKMLAGQKVDKPDAAWIQTIMFALCLPFVTFSISWFVANRKAQKAAAAAKAAKK